MLCPDNPGLVLISIKCGTSSITIKSVLEKPDIPRASYTFAAVSRTFCSTSADNLAGVISSDFPKYLAS
ncbi:hypothetical protein D9M70_644790 [compost metagenome]